MKLETRLNMSSRARKPGASPGRLEVAPYISAGSYQKAIKTTSSALKSSQSLDYDKIRFLSIKSNFGR